MSLPPVQIVADVSAFIDQVSTYCPITHSSLAHPRANLQFTNHVSITFIKDVNYCPTCGKKI
jgi:hypothetical protein